MIVYLVETPDGRRWRIQAAGQKIEIWERYGDNALASAPTARFNRMGQLEQWLRKHGRGLADLVER